MLNFYRDHPVLHRHRQQDGLEEVIKLMQNVVHNMGA